MPKLNQIQSATVIKIGKLKDRLVHGPYPKKKAQSSKIQPRWLTSGTITSLLTTSVPCIYSYQQVDDHPKRENHRYKTYNKQQKGKLELKVILSCNQVYFHSQLLIHHPSML